MHISINIIKYNVISRLFHFFNQVTHRLPERINVFNLDGSSARRRVPSVLEEQSAAFIHCGFQVTPVTAAPATNTNTIFWSTKYNAWNLVFLCQISRNNSADTFQKTVILQHQYRIVHLSGFLDHFLCQFRQFLAIRFPLIIHLFDDLCGIFRSIRFPSGIR